MNQAARLAGLGRMSTGSQRMQARKGRQDTGKCARKRGKEEKRQKAILLYFTVSLGLGLAFTTLNLEGKGSRKLRCMSAVFICSSLKVAIS